MSNSNTPGQPAHWGQGGQFCIDPVTGDRQRVGPAPAEPGAYANPATPAAPTIPVDAPAVDSVSVQTSAAADGAVSIHPQQKKAKNV